MIPTVLVLWEDWADQSLHLPAYQTAGAAGAASAVDAISAPAVSATAAAIPAARLKWRRESIIVVSCLGKLSYV